jgi:hypothetical protein
MLRARDLGKPMADGTVSLKVYQDRVKVDQVLLNNYVFALCPLRAAVKCSNHTFCSWKPSAPSM